MELDLLSVLFTREVIVISAWIFAVLFFLGKIPIGKKGRLSNTRWWSRLLPVLPLVLGIAAAFFPGVLTVSEGESLRTSWGNPLMIGIWSGLVASQGRKIIKRLFVDKAIGDKIVSGKVDRVNPPPTGGDQP